MFCVFDTIYMCGINELENLNLINFAHIINCSDKLNNVITNNKVINANLNKPINFMIHHILELLEFIYTNANSGKKIILVDETGVDNVIFIGIMFMMKLLNKNFVTIYQIISANKIIHPEEYYNSIKTIEYYLLNSNNNAMFTHKSDFIQYK